MKNDSELAFKKFRKQITELEKQVHERDGLNRSQFCERAGVPVSTYRTWVNGLNKRDSHNNVNTHYVKPDLPNLIKICDTYGVTLDYLFGRATCKTEINELIHLETGLNDDAITALRKDKHRLLVTDGVNRLLSLSLDHYLECSRLFTNIVLYLLKGKRHFTDEYGTPINKDDWVCLNTDGHGYGIKADQLDGVFLTNITYFLSILKYKL